MKGNNSAYVNYERERVRGEGDKGCMEQFLAWIMNIKNALMAPYY